MKSIFDRIWERITKDNVWVNNENGERIIVIDRLKLIRILNIEERLAKSNIEPHYVIPGVYRFIFGDYGQDSAK